MPVYTKKDGCIYCVYYEGKKRIWESFGRGKEALKAAGLRDLEIKAKKIKGFTIGGGTTFHELTHLARDIRKETAHKLPKIALARPNSRQQGLEQQKRPSFLKAFLVVFTFLFNGRGERI